MAGSLVALALVLAAGGRAGSQDGTFPPPFVAPLELTTGATGLAGAKFTPTGLANSGSATHVVISLALPADATSIKVTACPGTASPDGHNPATCSLGSVQAGQTVKLFATFTAGSPGQQGVIGTATWDKPSGGTATGAANTAGPFTTTFTIDSPTDAQQGKCTSPTGTTPDSVSGADATIGKSTSVTYTSVDSSFGFPCTPAQAGVVDSSRPGFTRGDWTLLVPPLAGGALANAALTLNDLPTGTTWKKFQIFELPSLTVVPACTSTGALPNPASDSCIYDRGNIGKNGVKLLLHVQGSTIDPSYTG